MWSVYSGYLYEGVFSEKCIAPGIEVEKQSQVLEEKLAERCKLAKGRPCVDFKVVDVNGKEGMFSDYVGPPTFSVMGKKLRQRYTFMTIIIMGGYFPQDRLVTLY